MKEGRTLSAVAAGIERQARTMQRLPAEASELLARNVHHRFAAKS